jgi:hypothetical protein
MVSLSASPAPPVDVAGTCTCILGRMRDTECIGADWTGSFFQTGGWAFTQDNKASNMTIRHTGGDLNLTMTMSYPWGYPYTFELGSEARLTQVATMQHDSSGMSHRIQDETWAESAEVIRAGAYKFACLRQLRERSFQRPQVHFEFNMCNDCDYMDRVRFAQATWAGRSASQLPRRRCDRYLRAITRVCAASVAL